jgi:uncharacterized protein (DUF1800 family)
MLKRADERAGMSAPVYRGRFGKEQAERLLWRAGFGPRPGEAEAVAKLGLRGAVHWLTHPPKLRLTGKPPRDERGRPLAPADVFGHDELWWLDRMVRTNQPLVERMTLIWHDWFATSNGGVASQRLMLFQNETFRRNALGSFHQLLLDVTTDPAMLQWLSGYVNRKEAPNENYARELMELFTLGAGRGYTERDVREQARALTGWTGSKDVGPRTYAFTPNLHDFGKKTIFGKTGKFDWRDSCRLCLQHRNHRSFFVRKLWSYFVPEPPDGATERALEGMYARSYQIKPVVQAILMHPRLYTGPRLVKPAVVYTAGLLRAREKRVAGTPWQTYTGSAGQALFYPPSVAGWDDNAWLDTSRLQARWLIADRVIDQDLVRPGKEPAPHDPAKLVARARAFWGNPTLTARTHTTLVRAARRALATADAADRQKAPAMVENVLRYLIAVAPEVQAS